MGCGEIFHLACLYLSHRIREHADSPDIKMRASLLAPILPRVMEEGEKKKAALILMKNSHFDRTLRYSLRKTPKLFNPGCFLPVFKKLKSTLKKTQADFWKKNSRL